MFSLVSLFAYFSKFWGFIILGLASGLISLEAADSYFSIHLIGLAYTAFALYRARNAELYTTAQIKGDVKKPINSNLLFFACTLIPFGFHVVCLEEYIILDFLVCILVCRYLIYNRDTGFILNVFNLNTYVHRVKIGKEEVMLIVDYKKDFPEIKKEDTVEMSHIAGNYYVLMRVIKQEELVKNNATEETIEPKKVEEKVVKVAAEIAEEKIAKVETVNEKVVEPKVVELNTTKADIQNSSTKDIGEMEEKTAGI